jgi:hypothetical protein
MVLAVFSIQAQETTSSPATPARTEPEQSDQLDGRKYVFPTQRERFDRYVSNTVGPFRLVRTGVTAGIDQWRDKPEEWGQGLKGYGKRYASALGRNAIQQTVTYGLDEALNLDSGFQRSGREGFFPRFKHALLETVMSRTRSGKPVVSAPRLAGVYAGGIIATETWYPDRHSYKDGLRIGTGTLITGFGINLVREFLISW